MTRFKLLASLTAMLILSAPAWSETVRGTVFHDRDGNGVLNDGEPGIPGVMVSNGVDVVLTDRQGGYEIELPENAFVYVNKPTGWKLPLDEHNLPRFFYAHYPKGSPVQLTFPGFQPTGTLPAAINFPLMQQEEPDEFSVIVFGDPQVRNVKEVGYLARDIVQDLVGDDSAFGISLGDLAFDDLRVYEPLNQVMSQVGIPWVNVHGNHDMNFKAKDDTHAADTYKRIYGPTDFIYSYSDVHFLVLDNVHKGPTTGYHAELGEERLRFIENILKHIPDDERVVVSFHIPMSRLRDLEEFFAVLQEQEKLLVLSAHFHRQYHEFYGSDQGWNGTEPLHHLVHVTACGNWWGGNPDEHGIPDSTMGDGAPNGWSYLHLDGDEYRIEYRAARRPADYQMDIDYPDVISRDEIPDTLLTINVFGGSERSTVRMRIRGQDDWVDVPRREDRNHQWHAAIPQRLPVGVHTIEVETTDMFDITYTDYHVVRVTE